ncbi:MAG TPA: arginase family protein, partial [Acidobacteriota bacterium]|nr:arginase family protein [Acidobacteriota bacterium]
MQTQSPIALLGFCSDENSSFRRGAAQAPPLIRDALLTDASNMWTETGVNLGELQEKNLLIDVGDIAPTPGDDFFDQIQTTIHQLLAQQISPISLGGDHAITFPILQGFARHFPEITILHIDAHP